jgi:cell division septal protein FtsQ
VKTLLLKLLRSSVVVAVISLGLFLWAYHSPEFRVEDLFVEGTSSLSPEELVELTSIKPGRNQLGIDLKEEALNVITHPLVAEVELARSGLKGIVLKVKEESPASVIRGERCFGLSLDGRILPYELCEGFLPLPILSAPKVSLTPLEKLKEPQILYALDFYRSFLKISPLWAKKVSRIALSRPLTINFGRGMFTEKIHRLTFILKENLYSLEEIELIDLRVADQVLVFPRGG